MNIRVKKAVLILIIATILVICCITTDTLAAGMPVASVGDPIVIPLYYDDLEINKPVLSEEVVVRINEYTGCTVDIRLLPLTRYNQELSNLFRVQGILPSILYDSNLKRSTSRYDSAGMSAPDITGYIERFPNLSAIDSAAYDAVSVDGMICGIPVLFPAACDQILAVHSDLYEKYMSDGGDCPKSFNELCDMLRWLSKNSISGYGMVVSYNMLDSFMAINGISPRFSIEGEVLIPSFSDNRYYDTLNQLGELYADGVIALDGDNGLSATDGGAFFATSWQMATSGLSDEYVSLTSLDTGWQTPITSIIAPG